jgi:3-hydroxyisobutyrate dehydrogenase-like beta-hydroxyacid dehydrogenase
MGGKSKGSQAADVLSPDDSLDSTQRNRESARIIKFACGSGVVRGGCRVVMPENRLVSFVGLGLLGGALARRLLKHGWVVRGFDPDPEASERFAEAGGIRCASLSECIEESCRIVLSLPESETARTVLEQILETCPRHSRPAGLVILDTTTGDPETMEQNAEIARVRGVGYLDACIGGSSGEAERGEAIIMVGGDLTLIESCRDLLETMASRVFPLDRAGAGARMKLITNLVLGLTRAALAEGLSLAEGFALDLRMTLEILEAGPARSHVMSVKGQKMIERNFEPQARLSQHRKDVQLILKAASQVGRSVPFSAIHDKILSLCIQEGWGDLDNSSVLLSYFSEKIAKLE